MTTNSPLRCPLLRSPFRYSWPDAVAVAAPRRDGTHSRCGCRGKRARNARHHRQRSQGNDQANSGGRINCVVKQVGKGGKITGDALELDDGVRSGIRQSLSDVVADTRISKTGKTSIDGTATFYEGKVSTGSDSITGVQAAKNLFASLRNDSPALLLTNQINPLDARVESMRADFRKAVAPADGNLLELTRLSITGIEFFHAYKSGTTSLAQINGYYDHAHIHGSCSIRTTGLLPASKKTAGALALKFVRKHCWFALAA